MLNKRERHDDKHEREWEEKVTKDLDKILAAVEKPGPPSKPGLKIMIVKVQDKNQNW